MLPRACESTYCRCIDWDRSGVCRRIGFLTEINVSMVPGNFVKLDDLPCMQLQCLKAWVVLFCCHDAYRVMDLSLVVSENSEVGVKQLTLYNCPLGDLQSGCNAI